MKLSILKFILILNIFNLLQIIHSSGNEKFLSKSFSENLASVFSLNHYIKLKNNNEIQTNSQILLEKNSNNIKFSNKNNLENKLENKLKEYPVEQKQDIIMQGWLKYLEMNDNSQEVPSSFRKNNVYFLQMQENQSINTLAKDNIGFLNIPNDQYHFFELTNTRLNLYSARPGKYRNFNEYLKISDIIPVVSSYPCSGGIEDVGSFAEGFCFLIKFIKFSKHFIWELCADNFYEKNNWVNKLVKIVSGNPSNQIITNNQIFPTGIQNSILTTPPPTVVLNQIPQPFQMINQIPINGPNPVVIPAGFVLSQDWSPCNKPCDTGIQTRILDCMDYNVCMGKKLEERLCNIQKCKEDIDNSFDKLKKVSEGQWEYLGSWTKCSKACGGGIRSISRRCVGGNCQGDAFVTEDCNTTICEVMTASDPNKMEISVFEREVYDECKQLEGNLIMMINNNRVLSHIEVNTQEIQIIKQNDPLHPIAFPISKLMDVMPSSKAPGCMDVIDALGKNIVLCPDAVKSKVKFSI